MQWIPARLKPLLDAPLRRRREQARAGALVKALELENAELRKRAAFTEKREKNAKSRGEAHKNNAKRVSQINESLRRELEAAKDALASRVRDLQQAQSAIDSLQSDLAQTDGSKAMAAVAEVCSKLGTETLRHMWDCLNDLPPDYRRLFKNNLLSDMPRLKGDAIWADKRHDVAGSA